MRKKVGILVGFVLLVLILAALNAATYVQREKQPDTEMLPNRSSYNAGSTGTQAFYSLLAETGSPVERWRSPIDELLTRRRNPIATFVMIGPFRRELEEGEADLLMKWVAEGGRLIVIDRDPPSHIGGHLKDWTVRASDDFRGPLFGIDPANREQMVGETPAARPVIPGTITAEINAVQTSKFASNLEFSPLPPVPVETETASVEEPDTSQTAYEHGPVVHVAENDRKIAVSIGHGAGSVVFVSDPYIVSNGGIELVDNAHFGVNLVTAGGGIAAFDEFHQGYGSGRNRLLAYFSDTPVIALFGQAGLAIVLIMFSRSRRFARPVPEPEPDRLTKLEYIGAMAELQQRTRAFDIAMESIYGEFRRRVAVVFGLDPRAATHGQIAKLISDRIKEPADEIEQVIERCQNVAYGEEVAKKEFLSLASKLREIESKLGMVRTGSRRSIR